MASMHSPVALLFHCQDTASMSTDDAELNGLGHTQLENDAETMEKTDNTEKSKASTLQLLAQLLGDNGENEVCSKRNKV
jgi:hypothetical protein